MFFQKGENLCQTVPPRLNAQKQVPAVETRDKLAFRWDTQQTPDIGADASGGGGRECHAHCIWEPATNGLQLPVLGPEIMAPLRNAVRLVHGEAREIVLLQKELCLRPQQRLRSKIENLDVAATNLVHGRSVRFQRDHVVKASG